MKYTILILHICIMLCISITVAAQHFIGLRGGISLATINFESDNGEEITNLLGADISIPFEIRVSNAFALQPELNYIRKGAEGEYTESELIGNDEYVEAFKGSVSLNYLAVPVFGKYIFETGNIDFFLLAGPVLGYALSGKNEGTLTFSVNGQVVNSLSDDADVEFNDEDGFKRFEFGLGFGAGVGANVGNGKLFLDARYNLGLSAANEDKTEGDKGYNRALSFALGYLIPLGSN